MYKVSQYTQIRQFDTKIIIFNTYSGAIAKIDEKMKEVLTSSKLDLSLLSRKAVEVLEENKFIVPYQLDEYQKIIDQEKSSLFGDDGFLTFVIAPTLNCNFSCSYCFEPRNLRKSMSSETISDVISYLKSQLTSTTKRIKITWFGGEPLLAIETIEKISQELIAYCDQNNIKYFSRIITNGYFLTGSVSEKLHNQCRVQSAQVTLDGCEKTHEKAKGALPGTYKKIIKNINEASNYMGISIRLNVVKTDYAGLKDIVDELMNHFKDHLNIRLYLAEVCDDWNLSNDDIVCKSPYWRQRRIFDDYVNKFYPHRLTNRVQLAGNNLKCGLIKKRNAVIGPDGELYRCEHMLGRADEIIGLCKEGLYHNQADRKFDSFEHPNKCMKCIIFPICMTECPNDIIENKTNRIDCDAKIDTILHEFVRVISKDRYL